MSRALGRVVSVIVSVALLAGSAVSVGLLGGCDSKRPAAPEPVLAPRELPVASRPAHPLLLWRAQVGASVLHLLGSVHVARPELYPLDSRIENAFDASDVLVLELDLDTQAQLAAAHSMLEAGRLPAGVRLNEVIAPETWELLQKTQERRGGSLFGLRGFRPWFVALTLTTQALEAAGFSAEHGIDEHFRRRAGAEKPIRALETVEEQLALFTGLSPSEQEDLLHQTLSDIDQYAVELDAAFRAWSRGDAAAINHLLVEPMRRESPQLFQELFTERNRRMTAKLLEWMNGEPARYFVVVGAGHLIGEDGIVNILRSRGIVAAQL